MFDIKDSVYILKEKPYILYGPYEIINNNVGSIDDYIVNNDPTWHWLSITNSF